jgi:outer membrane protein OmpA-like peptidoglycan-associated protein
MKNRFLLGAGIALAVALSWADARAQLFASPAGPGAWYIGGEGGWTSLENQTGHFGDASLKAHYDSGFNIGARAGYEWGPWRFEEEFRYQQNELKSLSFGSNTLGIVPGSHHADGHATGYAFMTNAIYDFTFGWPITPHVGVGVGAVELRDSFGLPGIGSIASNTDWEFGYQGIAGIRYNINPALAFDVDYRYLATTGGSKRTATNPVTHLPVSFSTGDIATNSVVASLTVRFGAAPPPVAPPPAPPAPPPVMRKVFLVFFDWDKATITPEGMQIVQQAANAFHGGAPVTIQVTGYTDRSGSPGYNQRLSERRANNVAGALVGLGVPRQAMAVSGRGENDNRVPTADGVREPQNRRVEIVFP